MKDEIMRVRYRWGLTERPRVVDALPIVDLRGRDIPRDILASIEEQRILELGGTRGDPDVGTPVEVDDLVIETPTRETAIRVYNRGIHLLATDDDELVRIHRVCCKLQELLPNLARPQVQVMRGRRRIRT